MTYDEITKRALKMCAESLRPDAFARDGDILSVQVIVKRKNMIDVVSTVNYRRDLKKMLKDARKDIEQQIAKERAIHAPVVEPVETMLRFRSPIRYEVRVDSKS